MVSAVEQMAANTSWSALGKAKDLRNRILFTLGLLCVYRLGTFIPVPGIDGAALREFMEQAQTGIGGMLSMFTGGALGRMGIFALGIMPYISASIIVQLLTSMVPSLEQLKKEGEQGRKKINQYTRYGTVLLATFQAYGLAVSLESGNLVTDPGVFFRTACVITLVGGTMFLMWLGEQITARGIGNGISLIIFVGIIAEIPAALAQFFASGRSGAINPAVIVGVIVMVVVTIAFVVFMERALRKIMIQYPRRQVGMKVMEGQNSHLPVKVNPAGVIPAIFASSLLLLPTTISTFSGSQTGPIMSTILAYFGPGQPAYLIFFAAMIIFFTYFYTAIVMDPNQLADNMKKHGGFIPGIRPGPRTAQYIDGIMTRITLPGSIALALVAIFPFFVTRQFNVAPSFAQFFGGTGLLIVVGVALDTLQQIESQLMTRHYEGFMKRGKIQGRRN